LLVLAGVVVAVCQPALAALEGVAVSSCEVAVLAAQCAPTAVTVIPSVVAYDEAESGDLPVAVDELPRINLSSGTNLIRGRLTLNADIANKSDSADNFLFLIEMGHQVDSLLLRLNVSAPGTQYSIWHDVFPGDRCTVDNWCVPGLGLVSSRSRVDGQVGEFDLLNTNPPLATGTYMMLSWLSSYFDVGEFTVDWEMELAVSAVPVPAAVWLFGAGIVSLAGIRRRTRYVVITSAD
jgi:hypothetical protein